MSACQSLRYAASLAGLEGPGQQGQSVIGLHRAEGGGAGVVCFLFAAGNYEIQVAA